MPSKSAKKPVTAGIIRVSTKAQGEGQSPENQRQVLRKAGASVFYEATESGFKADRRQSLEPLFRDIERGKIARLLATDLSRAARSDKLLDELIQLCDEHGVEFLAGGLSLSHESAYQWFSAKQMQLQAELYSRDLQGRIKRGQESCRERGVFGFTSKHLSWHLQKNPDNKHEVIAKPECWDDARTAVINYTSGEWSVSEMCAFLYEKHGVFNRTAAGLKWLRSGWLRGHYASRQTGEIHIANIAPPLINEEEYEALQVRFEANLKRQGTRAPHKIRALSKVCKCSRCGNWLTYSTRATYCYFRCQLPQCKAYNKSVDPLEMEINLQRVIGERVKTVAESDLQSTLQSKPSKELLNLKTRCKQLKAVLDLMESPGVRADYEQSMSRIQQLETAMNPDDHETAMSLGLYGSIQWWAAKSDPERQSAFLMLMTHAVVDPLRPLAKDGGPDYVIDVSWR